MSRRHVERGGRVVTRRWALGGLSAAVTGSAALLAACAGQTPGQTGKPATGALAPAKVTFGISWNPDVDPWNQRLPLLRDAFLASHPGWEVEWFSGAPGHFLPSDKLVAAIAAGEPPEVSVVGGMAVAAWATRSLVQAIDDRVRQSRIVEADYWAPSWRQHVQKGKTWALPWNSDANFAMLWNKQVFEEVGLKADQGPATVAEMEEMDKRITRREAGRLSRLGIHPLWDTYGYENSIYTWGWVFGGEFYDEKTQKVTADHPQVIKALEWMVAWTKRNGGFDEIDAFRKTFQTREQTPIFVGQIGMRPVHGGYVEDIARYAPEGRFGFGHLPAGPAPARPRAAWVGGWSLALLPGSKHPEQGWELMRWLSQSVEGTSWIGKEVGWYPAYKNAPFWEEAQKDPNRVIFYEILKEARHQRPVMPANAELGEALGKAVQSAIKEEQTPGVLLQDVTREAQRILDERLAQS
jgi:multiple sugar transport system substrate-binding protein